MEVRKHYRDHMRYVCGHLGEAEDHLLLQFPEIARQIREHRVAYRQSFIDDSNYDIPFEDILDVIEDLVQTAEGEDVTVTLPGDGDGT
jgi:hypothetical protein